MALTSFDCLPNELVMKILSYFSGLDGWFIFGNLNIRLNNLLLSCPRNIDFSNCNRQQFDVACQYIFPRIQNPFAISFFPRLMVESTDRLFLALKLNNCEYLLQSLTLVHVNNQFMSIIAEYLNNFVNLHSLTVMHDPEKVWTTFVATITKLNLPSLSYIKLGCIAQSYMLHYFNITFDELYSNIENVRTLILKLPITVSTFCSLLYMLPYLVSTDVILVKDKGTKTSCARDFSAVLQKLVLSMSDEIRFEIIAEILHKLPQLRTFWYIAFICDNYDGKEYQDGQVWEQLIRTYLPNLIDFRLHVGLERERGVGPSNIIQSFCTSFWIEKKKWWFVADQPDNNADTIELYSLPPPVNCKIIFRTNVQWASNSSNPNFKSVRTLGLLPTSNRSMSSVPNTRYFPNVTTIRSASSYGFDFFFDISILSACIDLTKIKNCVIVNRDLIKALPAMTNLTTMEIRHVSADIEDFKKNYSSIPTLKKLSLGTYSSDYGCDQNDLTIITSLFSNLEHIQLSIGELESLNILFAKLSHLIYATIYYKIEVINRQHLEQWLNDHEAIIKFTWSIDDDRLDIWMD